MPSKKATFFLILCLILTACQPAASTPTSELEVWKVERSPALEWMGSSLNGCALEQNNLGIALVQKPGSDADITLSWGQPASESQNAYLLGQDELVLIIHPDNPLQEISLDSLKAVYDSEVTSWSQFQEDQEDRENSNSIQTWRYPDGNAVEQIFEEISGSSASPRSSSMLAPDPQAMRSAVSGQSAAIGFLPSRWVDSSVKVLRISGLSAEAAARPILAWTAAGEPTPEQEAWLLCLQEKINAR